MAQEYKTQLQTLYESLKADNYDVPDTYDSFARTLTATDKDGETSRRALYDSLKADNYDVPDTYDSFARTLFKPESPWDADAWDIGTGAPYEVWHMGSGGRDWSKGDVAPTAVAPNTPAPAPATSAPQPASASADWSKEPAAAVATQPAAVKKPKKKPTQFYAMRRDGKDFAVSVDEVNAAGGLEAWAKAHPGTPVRIYMVDQNDNTTEFDKLKTRTHVELSEAPKQQGKKFFIASKIYEPTKKDMARFNEVAADGMRHMHEVSEMAKRNAERYTEEGRKKQAQAKWMALISGLPTSLVSPEAAARPGFESAASPVPYDVVMEDGERKVQWLLGDGRLTTSYIEALRADGEARRLQNEMGSFVSRMKSNGLDPTNDEDWKKQQQLDYEAPLRAVVDKLWAEAGEKDRKAEEEYRQANKKASTSWTEALSQAAETMANPMSVGNSRSVQRQQRDLERAVKGKQAFDLELMADKAYKGLPASYRNAQMQSYIQYFNEHKDELRGRSVQKAADDALRSEVYSVVYKRAVDAQMPKSKTEFLIRKITDLPILSSQQATNIAASAISNSWGMNEAELDAMSQYGQNHRALDLTGSILNFAVDPTVPLSGAAGSAVGRQAMRYYGKQMIKKAASKAAGKQAVKGVSKGLAERLASRISSGRLVGQITGASANLAAFEAQKDIQHQLVVGGVADPETGERGFSFGSVVNSGVHGGAMGAVTGVVMPLFGNVGDWAVKRVSNTAGKVGVRATELVTSKVFEGTIFAMPDMYNIQTMDDDTFDAMYAKRFGYDTIRDENERAKARKEARGKATRITAEDSIAMMIGLGLPHAIKAAPQHIASLRPIKPTDGRPLSPAERRHNQISFAERLRNRLDASPRDLDLTKQEREELRRAGYGDLADLFVRKPKSQAKSQAKEINPTITIKQDDGTEYTIESHTDVPVENAETIGQRPELDGYEQMERLMKDRNVSWAVRSKMYYILIDRMLPPLTITGHTRDTAEDGSIIINSVTADGEVVTSRRFSSEREAQNEIEAINRQAELNTIDVGERYKEALANEAVFMAAVKEVSRGADPQAIRQIYEAVKRGDENVTESQRQLVEFLDEAMDRNAEAGAEHRPEVIRERIKKETGLDVDKALRKQPKDRTDKEQALVERYARELFPEQKQKEQHEPSPEQAEADRMYEESRLLYGRREQGDPDAQAEIDAIGQRMQEAYQMCEDAFGTEAEYYMYRVNENPWSLINDPALTPDQQDAVLEYINAKAALDGVMDASHEATQRKREQVEREIAGRTHKDSGVIMPATLKVDDEPVYIVKGVVAMFADGSGVDEANSSESIIIMDASGKYRFVSSDQISKVGESIDPEAELQAAYERIDAERQAILGEVAGAEAPARDQETLQAEKQKLPDYDSMTGPWDLPSEKSDAIKAEEQRLMAEYGDELRSIYELEDDKFDEAIKDFEDNKLPYGFTTRMTDGGPIIEAITYAEPTYYNQAWLDNGKRVWKVGDRASYTKEGDYRPLEVTKVDENGKIIEAVDDEQGAGRRIVIKDGRILDRNEVIAQPTNAQTAPSGAPINEAAPAEVTALSQIPVGPDGKPQFEAVEPQLAADGLLEAAGGDATSAAKVAAAMTEKAKADVEKLRKRQPKRVEPELSGDDPLAMLEQLEQAKKVNSAKEQKWMDDMAAARERAMKWEQIRQVFNGRRAKSELEARRAAEERAQAEEAERAARAEAEQRKAAEDAERRARELAAIEEQRRWEESPEGRAIISAREQAAEAADRVIEDVTDAEVQAAVLREDKYQGGKNYVKAYERWGAPVSLDEWVARVLSVPGRVKVRWSGKDGLENALFGRSTKGERVEGTWNWLTSDANGVGFDEWTHHIWEGLLADTDNVDFNASEISDHEVRNAIIEQLLQKPTSRSLFEYARELHGGVAVGMTERRAEAEYDRPAIEADWYERRYGMSREDFEAREEEVYREIREELNDDAAFESILEQQIEGYEQRRFEEENAGGAAVLPGAETDNTRGGAGAAGAGPGTTGGARTDDGRTAPQAPGSEIAPEGGQPEPTEGQKAAGNYKMEHRNVDGYKVSIENAKGSVRRGKDADGTEWKVTMQNDYGYIRGTQGVDGDHIDVFLSDTPEQGDVFVIDQVDKDGNFDEHKVMYDFPSEKAAREAYLSNYEPGWTGLGAITHVSKEEFKKWIGSSKRKTKPFAEYASVKPIDDEVNMPTTLKWSNERADNGEPFLIGTNGSIDLVEIEQDVFDKMGIAKAPFRLTPSMVTHVYERHKKELKLKSPEDAVEAILDVMNNFDHVRKGRDNTFIFSAEGTRSISARRAVTFVLEYDKGEWLGIKTVGYDRIPNLKELTTLWEKGEGNSSTTGVAPANVSSEQPSQGNQAAGIASNQSVVISDGKDNTLSPDRQDGASNQGRGKAKLRYAGTEVASAMALTIAGASLQPRMYFCGL